MSHNPITNEYSKISDTIASKTTWKLAGSASGQTSVSVPSGVDFDELLAVIRWGVNDTVTVSAVYPKEVINGKTQRYLGGNYTSPSDYHNVQVDFINRSVSLNCWISNRGNDTAGCTTLLYYR